MKLIKINVSKDVEDVLYHKRIIEDFWIENKVIQERTNIEQFISMLDMTKRIYIQENGEKILPFVYILINDTLYFFYVSDDDTLANQCLDDIKKFEFDFTKLRSVTNEEIIDGILNNKHYFAIDGEYYIYESLKQG